MRKIIYLVLVITFGAGTLLPVFFKYVQRKSLVLLSLSKKEQSELNDCTRLVTPTVRERNDEWMRPFDKNTRNNILRFKIKRKHVQSGR